MISKKIDNQDIRIFPNALEAAQYLADELIADTTHYHAGKFNVALSGGTTPGILFDELAKKDPHALSLKNINWFWGDERMVHPLDEQSNYRMFYQNLLSKIPVGFTRVFRVWGEEKDAELEATRYEKLLNNVLPKSGSYPVFDLVILGLGVDGHTASIFPDQWDLLISHKWIDLAFHPETQQKRLTLTGEVLKNAKNTVFLVTGSAKADVAREILLKEGQFKKYPASFVGSRHGKTTWIMDAAAAAKL